MSKYHTIKLDREYRVRDVPFLPNSRKLRVGTTDLRDKIMEMLAAGDQLGHLGYINSRIHFFIEGQHLDEADEVILSHIERDLIRYKNTIEIQ